jgi:hypothetical protein
MAQGSVPALAPEPTEDERERPHETHAAPTRRHPIGEFVTYESAPSLSGLNHVLGSQAQRGLLTEGDLVRDAPKADTCARARFVALDPKWTWGSCRLKKQPRHDLAFIGGLATSRTHSMKS